MGDPQRTAMDYPLGAQRVSLTSNRPPTTAAATTRSTRSTTTTTTTTALHQSSRPHTTACLPTPTGDQQGMVMGYPLVPQPVSLTSNMAATNTTSTRSTTTTTANHQTTGPHTTASKRFPTSEKKKLLIALIITAAMVSFFAFLLFQCSTPKFKVNSVLVYPFNISSSHIIAKWRFTFNVENPNLARKYLFHNIRVSVFYKETNFSSTMENFKLKTLHKTSSQANVGVFSMNINSSVADAMAADWSHGVVIFNVTVKSALWVDNELKSLMVSCKEIRVGFLPNMVMGRMLGGSRKCHASW